MVASLCESLEGDDTKASRLYVRRLREALQHFSGRTEALVGHFTLAFQEYKELKKRFCHSGPCSLKSDREKALYDPNDAKEAEDTSPCDLFEVFSVFLTDFKTAVGKYRAEQEVHPCSQPSNHSSRGIT